MAWPQSQDYNEAIQSPQTSFGDAELRGGQAVTNALGMPMPRSGNFADVYEFLGASGQKWAVKCFTRQVPGLQERYGVISKHLVQAKLPFTVDFSYLAKGIRIGGEFYPILKMQWVEGFLLNEFVRDNLDKPALLDGLAQIWLRMAKRLAEADIAHADLQHGNVILVPGSKASSLAVKLIDYDGMWLAALAQKKSGEVGHPNYQHPERLRQGTYSAAVDRLPLLAIACALRCLAVGGKALWDKHDNGDNLLFRETDLRNPAASALFKELWNINDPASHDLTGYLVVALTRPLAESSFLPELINADRLRPLATGEEENVAGLLGPGAVVKRSAAAIKPLSKVKLTSPPSTSARPSAPAAPDWDFTEAEQQAPRASASAGSAKSTKTWLAVAAALAVCAVSAVAFWVTRKGEPAKNMEVAMVDRDINEPKQTTVKPKDVAVPIEPKNEELPSKKANPPVKNETTQPQSPIRDIPEPLVTPVPPSPKTETKEIAPPPRITKPPVPNDGNEPVRLHAWDHLTKSPTGVKEMDGYLSIDPGSLIGTKKAYSGPIEITAVVRSFNQPVYLHAFDGKIIYNLPGDRLRLHRPGITTSERVFDAPGNPPLPSNTWHKIKWRISEHTLNLSLDDRFVLSEGGSYDLSHGAAVLLHAINRLDVKELAVVPLPPDKIAQAPKGADAKHDTEPASIMITPALLKKKLHGKAKYDKNTGTLTLAYDFQSPLQLKDFDFGKGKGSLGSGGYMLLQPNTQAKHIVKFKDVTITAKIFVKAMRGRVVSATDGSNVSFGGLNPDTIYMDSGRLGHREFVVPPNERTGYIPMRFAIVQPQVAFKYGRYSVELGAGSEPKAGFVEFHGGEQGYSFGQLTLSGKMDNAWAEEFFGGPVRPALPEKNVIVVAKKKNAVKEETHVDIQRGPVPPADAVEKEQKDIRERYKKDYAKKTAAGYEALAERLLQVGLDTNDDVTACYVLLGEARDLAVKAGLPALAVKIAGDVAERYEVDGPALKLATLRAVAKLTPKSHAGELVDAGLGLAEDQMAQEDFDKALSIALTLETAVQRVNNVALATEVRKFDKQAKELAKEFAAVKKARAKLAEDPADADANAVTGIYTAFRKGQWDDGLARMARSGTDLEGLAKMDLAKPATAKERVELGDAWWATADKKPAYQKTAMQARAAYWYGLALADLKGNSRDRIVERIKQAAEQPPPLHIGEVLGEIQRLRHKLGVTCMSVAADGKRLHSGSKDGLIREWNLATGKVRVIMDAREPILFFALAPDEKNIAAVTTTGLHVWSMLTYKPRALPFAENDVVAGICWVNNANIGLMRKRDSCTVNLDGANGGSMGCSPMPSAPGSLATCRLFVGAPLLDSPPSQGSIASAASLRLSAFDDGVNLIMQAAADGRRSRQGNVTFQTASGAFSHDGKSLLLGGQDGTLQLYEIDNLRNVKTFTGHAGPVKSVAFSANDQRILSGGDDKTVRIWDAITGKELHSYNHHTGPVRAVAFTNDGRYGLSASLDASIREWSLPR